VIRHCVVFRFADDAGFLAYSGHPAHVEVVERFVQPIVTERHAVQFRC
jgi:hypothetical protein